MVAPIGHRQPLAERLGLDAAYIGRLDRLSLLAKQRMRGLGAGPRRSLATGSSVEFADFRTYAPGDDFRRVDWSAYARLERLFLRIFEAEENTTLSIFVDCSDLDGRRHAAEAAAGAPAGRLARPTSRWPRTTGWRSAASATGLVRTCRRGRGGSARPSCGASWPSCRRRAAPAWRRCAATRRYSRGPGLAVVISDLLTDSDWRAGLRALRAARGRRSRCCRSCRPRNCGPSWTATGRWWTPRTASGVEVTLGRRCSGATRSPWRRTPGRSAAGAGAQRIAFVQVSSATPIDELVLRLLRRIGVHAMSFAAPGYAALAALGALIVIQYFLKLQATAAHRAQHLPLATRPGGQPGQRAVAAAAPRPAAAAATAGPGGAGAGADAPLCAARRARSARTGGGTRRLAGHASDRRRRNQVRGRGVGPARG